MGLESLFAFTMLGGLAAGTYVFETVLRKTREGDRPWLVPLAVVVLFAVGLAAAATHVHSFAHAFDSLFSGTVNFGAGMVHEVAVSGLFFVLALIDLMLPEQFQNPLLPEKPVTHPQNRMLLRHRMRRRPHLHGLEQRVRRDALPRLVTAHK